MTTMPKRWLVVGSGPTRQGTLVDSHQVGTAAPAHCAPAARPARAPYQISLDQPREHKRLGCHLVACLGLYHSARENSNRQRNRLALKREWTVTSRQRPIHPCSQPRRGRALAQPCILFQGRTCLRMDTTRRDMAQHDLPHLLWAANHQMAMVPPAERLQLVGHRLPLEQQACIVLYNCQARETARPAAQTLTTPSGCSKREVQANPQCQKCRPHIRIQTVARTLRQHTPMA